MNNIEYIELAILLINQLIDGKNNMLTYISDTKDNNALKFKIRNYHKWTQRLNSLKSNTEFINATLDEDLILNQKFTTHLERKMIEILNTNKLKRYQGRWRSNSLKLNTKSKK